MTNTTAALEAEAKAHKSQITLITETFALVAAGEQIPASHTLAARVATNNGYIRWSSRARRYMFTDEGKKFYRSMRRFAPTVARILGK